MWAEMALQLQLNMGPMSSYPHLALEKMVRESSGACMITVEKGYWSPCMRETWMPHVNICGDDGCDVHSTGTGVCSVRVDGAAYSLTHCGVFPAPAVNQAQGKDVHLFCPAAVPIAVFPILKCAHTALSQWLAKLESAETQQAVWKLLSEFHLSGKVSYLEAAKKRHHYAEVNKLWLQNEVNYGGPESFFNTLLDDVNLLGHNATLPSKVGWSLKFTSRLLFATGGSLLPDSHLYLPPHLCGACCATGRNRLPVVVVRNPFSRLASGWRLTVVLPLQWSLQRLLNSTDLGAQDTVAALQELSDFGSFVSFVQRLLAGKAALNTVLEVAKAERLMDGRVPVWPASHPLSLGDLLHLIPVSEFLQTAPKEWRQQKMMFLHMEHLEEDLETLAKVLCSSYSYCEKLPSFPHIKPTDEHPREQWGQAEQSSWIYFRQRLQWTPNLAEQAAGIYSEDFQLLGYDPRRPEQQDPLHPSERW